MCVYISQYVNIGIFYSLISVFALKNQVQVRFY